MVYAIERSPLKMTERNPWRNPTCFIGSITTGTFYSVTYCTQHFRVRFYIHRYVGSLVFNVEL